MNTKEINPKDYLNTLQRSELNPKKFNISIEFDSYRDLSWTIQNITNVCINYLYAKEENTLLTDDLFDVIKLLEIQKQLIPFDEMELLDKLQEKI